MLHTLIRLYGGFNTDAERKEGGGAYSLPNLNIDF